MNPWIILGWAVVAAVALVVVVLLWFFAEQSVIPWCWARWHHLQTRNTQPAAGQRWRQGNTALQVVRIADNGRIVLTTGAASWSDSPEEWRERIRSRKLWLLKDRKEGK